MFTREEVLAAALAITREKGAHAVTARALGEKLGSSSKPIFSLFENMEDVQRALLQTADDVYQHYLQSQMQKSEYPPYKASGMAYIHFAREERELFRLLFMRDRSGERVQPDNESIRPLLNLIQQAMALTEEEALLFHTEMWVYVHGIATMIATSYLDWDEALISRVVSDGYMGLKAHYTARGTQPAPNARAETD